MEGMLGRSGARAWRRALPWLLLAAALAWGLGAYPLLDPDEGRNAEVAREMMASGDFVLPRLDGLPYLDKPVLFFAADALAQRALGANEAAARLPSLLFALATAALTGWFAGRLFGRRARPIAALAALAAPLPIAFARTVIFDSMLTFFVVLALCAFYLAVEARAARRAAAGGSSGLGWTVLAWGAMGLGVLTKGPVALAVPLLAAAPFAIVRRASRAVWHPLGFAVLALAVAPWIWAVSLQVPEFLHYALVVETFRRVTTPEMNREGPVWVFLPFLIAGALPWSVLVLAGWRRSVWPRGAGRRLDPPRLYLLLWIALPLALFSLSHSKRPQYILPLLPAVALLAAKVWLDAESATVPAGVPATSLPGADRTRAGSADVGGAAASGAAIDAAGRPAEPEGADPAIGPGGAGTVGAATGVPAPLAVPGTRAVAILWLSLAVLCAAAAPVLWRSHSARLAHLIRLPPTLLAVAAAFLLGAALVAGAAGLGGSSIAATGNRRRAMLLLGLVLPMAAMPALALPLLDEIAGHRSARAAAAAILPYLPPGAEVVGVRAFPPSLPFYLRRTVLIASPRGRELTSNYVIAYFQKWLAADPRRTPLRPFPWWRAALAACDRPRVFVAWADDADARAALAATGLPLRFVNDRMALYGPCAPRPPSPAAPPRPSG
jgi:4-amino-4-deoxy-L-arabinose transferase-like glycosyltransferase